jgi:hypothetical protein
MTQPIARRADQLVVGDRIPDEHLAFRFNQGPAEVVFVAYEDTQPLKWTFVAYRYPNGQHDSMTVRPEAVLQVYPADPTGQLYSRADDGETTQPIAGRMPPHYGAVTGGSLVPQPIAEHYDASEFAGDAVCACGESFGSVSALKDHIAGSNAVAASTPPKPVGTAGCGCPVYPFPQGRGDAADTIVEHLPGCGADGF